VVRIVAHPDGARTTLPDIGAEREVILAVGPEGGWVDYEIERFEELGFQRFSLGRRILRVETALPYLFGRLSL